MKRKLSLLLAGALCISLAACTNTAQPSESPSVQPTESAPVGTEGTGALTAGTYTASAPGMNGPGHRGGHCHRQRHRVR